MEPISEKREARFRGPTSSEDFNKWIEDNYFDLVQLFNLGTKNSINILDNFNMLVSENDFLSRKITSLQNDLESILMSISNINANPELSSKVLSKSFSSMENIFDLESGKKCYIDTKFGIAHLPLQQKHISKIYLNSDNGEPLLPKAFKARLYESTSPMNIGLDVIDEVLLVEDNNLYKAFDGKDNTFWQRSSVKTSTTEALYAVLDLELPQNIISHPRVNTIYLNPSPEFSFSILDIKYYRNSTWTSISTYPGIDTPEEINDISKITFMFEPQDILKLRIYIKQSNGTVQGDKKVFTYGFKSIDVNFTRFIQEPASMMIKFDIPNPEIHSFSSVTSIEPIFTEGGIKDPDLVKCELYTDPDGNSPAMIGDILNGLPKSVYVKVTLTQSVGASPSIKKLNITYTTS